MSLLSLPADIRHRIYDYCLAFHGKRAYKQNRSYRASVGPLLLTCREIYEELAPRYFAENELVLRWNVQGPERLRNIRPSGLAALTDLTILLNQNSCVVEYTSCCKSTDRHDPCDGELHEAPLDKSSSQWPSMLKEWQSVIQYLAAHVQSHLTLRLICDVADLETAKAIVSPLYSLPKLARCDLRLGCDPDPALRSLARTVANQLTGHPARTFFPFTRLPKELQIQILLYTNLLAPYREVTWTPDKGFLIRYGMHRCFDLEDVEGTCEEWYPKIHRGCEFRDCIGKTNKDHHYHGCWCQIHHASFSINCRCWTPPTPFFLVSRDFAQTAQEIFYSHNRFIVEHSAERPDRLEASLFLSNVVPQPMRPLLRQLDITIPPLQQTDNHPEATNYPDTAFKDWEETLRRARGEFDMPHLALRTHLEELHDKPLTPTDMDNIVNVYAPILRPLASLGLTRLFVFTWYYWQLPLDEPASELAQCLERFVMGETYDSEDLGKSQEVLPQIAWRWGLRFSDV